VSRNIQLVRNGLVKPVDSEHGTRMEHIASASATNPMTQEGHTVKYIMLQRKVECYCDNNFSFIKVFLLIFPFLKYSHPSSYTTISICFAVPLCFFNACPAQRRDLHVDDRLGLQPGIATQQFDMLATVPRRTHAKQRLTHT
jgi:hypothetical protein